MPNTSTNSTLPSRLALWVMGALIVLALATKAWLVQQAGFHWDEFWYLTKVHALVRGELTSSFQVVHGMFFSWLPHIGDEIRQLQVARWIMWALLVFSCALLYLLARRWCSPAAALTSPLVYLSMEPVLIHGGSFRADSIITPLLLGVLLILSGPSQNRKLFIAGSLWGLAVAITAKAVFLAPVALAVMWSSNCGRPARPGVGEIATRIGYVGTGALLALMAIFGLVHLLFDFAAPTQAVSGASAAASKVFSQWGVGFGAAIHMASQDAAGWLLIGLGMLLCLLRRSALWGLALSLAPILFYRNTFAYYYVVMLAPASVLASVFVQSILDRKPFAGQSLLFPAIAVALYLQAGLNLMHVGSSTNQEDQARILSAVHQVFPEPVPYIDHSGVVASFPKVNGFLSTWGIENYQAAAIPFMPDLLQGASPPVLLLADRDVLAPAARRHSELMPVDRQALASSYVNYWGPLWVAGTRLPPSGIVKLPFAGNYRLQGGSATIAGKVYPSGAVIHVSDQQLTADISASHDVSRPPYPSLVWAAAHPAPADPPPRSFYQILN